jgi:Ran GTPase-activating protein (RanGAP) involved in mRNA processing and transport
MGASGAAALTKAMLPLPVRKLDLAMNSLGDESVPAIARAILNIPTLKHVNLASNSIGLAGVMEISKCLGTLLSLDLSSVPGFPRPNNVDGAACAALSRALCRPSSLTSLSLSGNPIGAGTSGSKATELLAVMLTKYSRTLDALNLANTELGTRGGATIMAALAHNRSLRHLTLAGNGIGPDIGKAVEVVLRVNHVLCGLNLAHNPLGAAIPRFSDALAANGSIVVLDLSDVAAGDDGAHELANVLVSNRSITSLLLANNGITERGGQIIAQALYHNPVLTSLDLSGNPIKDAAAVELAKVLAVSATLITLDLSSCKISDEGACHLFSAIASNPNTALRKLRLHNNFISGASGDAILDALYRNRSLVTVDLGGNQLDHVRLSKLKALGQRNLAAIREIEPRRLRAAIQRLRGQQIKLRKAEALLQTYRATIADTQAKIDEVEQEKARFLKNQQERRAEIRQQIQKEQDAIAEANVRQKLPLLCCVMCFSDFLADFHSICSQLVPV